MKKLSIILACALAALVACTKSKEVHPEIGDGNDEIVTVGLTDVHVEYARTDHAELGRVLFHYCPADAYGNAQQFEVAEMTKKETFFELTLNDLLSDTIYWYYYELFPNGGTAINTIQKTFRTQAYDAPEPPTPPTPSSGVPEGAINGLFTINENGDQVYFSQGNLQYQASTNTWRFAENQWNCVGEDNSNISQTYNGWIDLFGWGTSGYNHGAICYQPWSSSTAPQEYYAYGDWLNDLSSQTGQADWGYNPISNGGNTENNGWKTPTLEEFEYLLHTRNTESGCLFAKAIVNNTKGVILLPDDWSVSYYLLTNINDSEVSYGNNVINEVSWYDMEAHGAVFFPAAGYRGGFLTFFGGAAGYYWLASGSTDEHAASFAFWDNPPFLDCGSSNRMEGRSVRLVIKANL